MPAEEIPDEHVPVNPGYAQFQLARALATSESHPDEATRGRAREKIRKWKDTLHGMLSGAFKIGSRQPIAEAPVWATPEVVTGGFVTGHLLAGGALLPHEIEQLQRLGQPVDSPDRRVLNSYYLSEAGLAESAALLRSGCFAIDAPEEGAMLVIAWLVENGHADLARDVIDILAPHFSRLRFYPRPTTAPARLGEQVHLETVEQVLKNIRAIRPNLQIARQREAIKIWTPLYEKMIALFRETVDGEEPTIALDAEGRWTLPGTRKFAVTGGWPGKHFPPGWKQRALDIWAEVERARSAHSLCGKPARAGDSFAKLCGYLKQAADDAASLTRGDVGMIRLILARHHCKYGAPGSEKHQRRQALQRQQITPPDFCDIAKVVAARLAECPADTGMESVDAVTQPVSDTEAVRFQISRNVEIPLSLRRKVGRCQSATAGVLVERGIIPSGDVLARVIPQFVSGLRASAYDDPKLQQVYALLYRAFRRRRSLLLLNLEKQISLEELPWVAAIEPFRRTDLLIQEISRRTLRESLLLTLRSFPQAIVPNKLLQEFRALAHDADLSLPLLDELAADIFMDDFSPKFTDAARRAAVFLEGTLYARYYGLDCATIRRLPDRPLHPGLVGLLRGQTENANPFAELCIRRAGISTSTKWGVARNGMVIEQAQIITTHNLAVLIEALDLAEALRDEFASLAETCFRWICDHYRPDPLFHHARLIKIKNSAYAWRQMIFYLSLAPAASVPAFLHWAEEYLRSPKVNLSLTFAPLIAGLAAVQAGNSLDNPAMQAKGARRFLGWSNTQHWLLAQG